MSGMPGMCIPIEDGVLGFDFRLAMGMPDYWDNTLQITDEFWDLGKMWYEMTTKRPEEKRIAYVESHDQAIVGSKTVMFRLADQEMYWHMNKDDRNIIVERATALHKMIRRITISTGAEGYMNFMGNEFGHPERIDFPREGNNYSYRFARRQWSLAKNGLLRYEYLNNWDRAMVHFMKSNNIMGTDSFRLWLDNDRKLLAFRKEDFVFIFNWHPQNSYSKFALPINDLGNFKVVLDTDQKEFGGLDRIDHSTIYESKNLENTDYDGIVIYVPSRTALVLKKI